MTTNTIAVIIFVIKVLVFIKPHLDISKTQKIILWWHHNDNQSKNSYRKEVKLMVNRKLCKTGTFQSHNEFNCIIQETSLRSNGWFSSISSTVYIKTTRTSFRSSWFKQLYQDTKDTTGPSSNTTSSKVTSWKNKSKNGNVNWSKLQMNICGEKDENAFRLRHDQW